jgi:hypothetical protein
LKQELRKQLLEMIAEDDHVREELAANGSLYEGYHPRMEQLHRNHASRLREMIQEHGWPGITIAATDGEEAAWRIAQHSIGEPEFLRSVLTLLKSAADNGEAPLWQVAMTEDRIRAFEGKSQLYGTSFDWDENGRMSPYPAIEHAESVDQRRASMGLPPLQDEVIRKRADSSEKPPANIHDHRKQMDQWAQSAGWRSRAR